MRLERINLVPQKPLAVRIKEKLPIIMGLLVVFTFAMLYTRHMSISKQIEETKKEVATLEQTLTNITAYRIELGEKKRLADSLSDQHKELLKELQILEQKTQGKKLYTPILARIAAALPPTALCKKIILKEGTAIISGEARGYDDLPDFLERLKKSDQFQEVTLMAVTKKKQSVDKLFEFTIAGELNQAKR